MIRMRLYCECDFDFDALEVVCLNLPQRLRRGGLKYAGDREDLYKYRITDQSSTAFRSQQSQEKFSPGIFVSLTEIIELLLGKKVRSTLLVY